MKKQLTELTMYKNRTLMEGEKVEVHYNLHEGGFSITSVDERSKFKGLVVARAPFVHLVDVTTKVSEIKRQRVIREQSKNVHAKICGIYTEKILDMNGARQMTYNPYKYESFVDKETEKAVLSAKRAVCVGKGALYI